MQIQNVDNKNNLKDTDLSTEIIPSSTATVCSAKIIDIEMDPPTPLFVPTTASSPISRLINMSVLADVFMLLSCPGCHSIQYIKLNDTSMKKDRFGKTFAAQLYCLFI